MSQTVLIRHCYEGIEGRQEKGKVVAFAGVEEATRRGSSVHGRERVSTERGRGWERGVSQRLAATSPISHRRLKTTGPLHLPCNRARLHPRGSAFYRVRMEWLTCIPGCTPLPLRSSLCPINCAICLVIFNSIVSSWNFNSVSFIDTEEIWEGSLFGTVI